MAGLSSRIIVALFLALTAVLASGCSGGCNWAASLLRVEGDSMGDNYTRVYAVPSQEQVCVARSVWD